MSLSTLVCRFCQNNGEDESWYRGHVTRSPAGKVQCPVLRVYTCPVCKATGDKAHTLKYCPENKDGRHNSGASLTDLKKLRNATGRYKAHTLKYCPENKDGRHNS